MAYEKHIWACGETITEAKLNNIEDGIEEALECCEGGGGGGIEILYKTESRTPTSDEIMAYQKIGQLPECPNGRLVDVYNLTYQEAKDACLANKMFGVKLPTPIEEMVTSPTFANITIDEDSSESIYSMFVDYASIELETVTGKTIALFAVSPSDYLISYPYCSGFAPTPS